MLVTLPVSARRLFSRTAVAAAARGKSWATLTEADVMKPTRRDRGGAPRAPRTLLPPAVTRVEEELAAVEERHQQKEELEKAKKKKRRKRAAVGLKKAPTGPPQDPLKLSLRYAGGVLANVPKGWFQESSVVKEALGIQERLQLTGGGEEKPALPEGGGELLSVSPDEEFEEGLADLHNRVAVLEGNAQSIRERHGRTEPTLKGPEEYLAVIRAAPSGVEAAVWLDELEMTRPEWLTPHHYEAAFLLAVEERSPLPERDILVMWVKSRQRKMVTPPMYAHLFAGLGVSSLRAVAFPFLWEACKRDFGGVAYIAPEVCTAVFSHLNKQDDVAKAVSTYLELAKGGCRIGVLAYLELLSILSKRIYKDQEVLDFMLEELQAEAGRAIEREGVAGIPRQFFSKALAACSPDSAVRLWEFMKQHGVRVTVLDYTNLLVTMSNSLRLSEARTIFKYLESKHPDYLWRDECAIPKIMLGLLKAYDTPGSRADMMYLFSEFFGPESGTPASRSAYLHLMDGCRDERLVHDLWKEMLARGMRLETRHYNCVFRNMGAEDAVLSYPSPPSPLDDEIPTAMVEARVRADEPPAKLPPPASDPSSSWNPYGDTPSLTPSINTLWEAPGPKTPPVWVPPPAAYQNIRRPHLAKEEALPGFLTSLHAGVKGQDFVNIMAGKRRRAAHAKHRERHVAPGRDEEGGTGT